MKKLILNGADQGSKIVKKEIDYFLDSERYDGDWYCGHCSLPISKEYLYQGTKLERYLGDGQPYRCEICDETCPSEHEYIGRNDEIFEKESLVFHRNCPCYCYFCPECNLNVLEEDEEDYEFKCEYGDHEAQRERLLERLGIEGETGED